MGKGIKDEPTLFFEDKTFLAVKPITKSQSVDKRHNFKTLRLKSFLKINSFSKDSGYI